jgi:hypothetical protein
MKTLHAFRRGEGASLRHQFILQRGQSEAVAGRDLGKSELVKHEEGTGHQAAKRSEVIPVELVAEIKR